MRDPHWVISPDSHVIQSLQCFVHAIKSDFRLSSRGLESEGGSAQKCSHCSIEITVFVVLGQETNSSTHNDSVAASKEHWFDESLDQVFYFLNGPVWAMSYLCLSFFLLKMMKGIKCTNKYILYRDLQVAMNWRHIFMLQLTPGCSCEHFSLQRGFAMACWMNSSLRAFIVIHYIIDLKTPILDYKLIKEL